MRLRDNPDDQNTRRLRQRTDFAASERLNRAEKLVPFTRSGQLEDAVFRAAAKVPAEWMRVGFVREGPPFDVTEFETEWEKDCDKILRGALYVNGSPSSATDAAASRRTISIMIGLRSIAVAATVAGRPSLFYHCFLSRIRITACWRDVMRSGVDS
jgi:hypothetical protein